MQANNVGERFVATGVQFVADLLSNVISRNWDMGRSNTFPEETRTGPPVLHNSNMRSEAMRLSSFQDWPSGVPVWPDDLAAAGFFFTGSCDQVECFCCGGALYDWLAGDDPTTEHMKFFPECPFIQGEDVGNQPVPQARKIQGRVDGRVLGMLRRSDPEETMPDNQPEYLDMELEVNRLVTFEYWPAYALMSPELLAKAGFFYTGQADLVRCFYCSGPLRRWSRGDDPWVEHARWYPRCKFLLRSQGRDFVNVIQASCVSPPPSPEAFINSEERASVSPQDNVEIWNLGSPRLISLVQSVLQMGFRPNSVIRLVQKKFQQMATSYPSLSELVWDLLQAQQDQSGQAKIVQEPVQREPRTEHRNEPGPSRSMQEQLRRLQEERKCKVCLDREVAILLVPCGHLVVCADCAPNLHSCPICRGVIQDSMRAFMS